MQQIMVIYTIKDHPMLLTIRKMFTAKLRHSMKIKETVNYMKLSRLTKLELMNVNTWLRKQELYIRIAVMGMNTWEVWYHG